MAEVNPKELNFSETIRPSVGIRTGGYVENGRFSPKKHAGDAAWAGKAAYGGLVGVVSDGVGDSHGYIMSHALVGALKRTAGPSADKMTRALIQGRLEARAIHPKTAATVTAVAIDKNILHSIHTGDSRYYLLRDGALDQMSNDYNRWADKVRRGEQGQSLDKHRLTEAINAQNQFTRLEQHTFPLQPGDVILICSDGIGKYIGDRDLPRNLQDALRSENPAQTLVDEAFQQARKLAIERIDDISAVILEVPGITGHALKEPGNTDRIEPQSKVRGAYLALQRRLRRMSGIK